MTDQPIIVEITYHNTLKEKGWNKLTINGFNQKDSFLQSYLAGYLEGRITNKDIVNFIGNVEFNYKRNPKNVEILEKIKKFFAKVNQSLINKIDKFNELPIIDKEYYYKIYIFYSQINGLHRGVNYERKKRRLSILPIEDLIFIQADGELQELLSKTI